MSVRLDGMTSRSNITDDSNCLTRRDFLAIAASAIIGLFPRRAQASDFNRFRLAQLVIGDSQPARPTALLAIGQEVRLRTTVDVKLERVVVKLGSRAMFEYPFLLWVGDKPFPNPSRNEIEYLKSYISSGGFILVDNAGEGPAMTAFDRQFRSLVERTFAGQKVAPVPANHVLMRSFYKLSEAPGRRVVQRFIEGLVVDRRIALLYSMNDLTGAWSRDAFGNWEFETLPGGPSQREAAIMFGVNVVMYALLLDYKDEQAHVEYLLKKRRLNDLELK